MKCEDSLELMHRELDADLDAEEQELLQTHLTSCTTCSEQFQRLQELSAQLEALPKVSPPFSIVDQLLPELGLSNNDSTVQTLSQEAADHSPRVSSGKKANKKMWISGLVMAACLCLALFALNKNPLSPSLSEQENAEVSIAMTEEASPAMESRSMGVPETDSTEFKGKVPESADSSPDQFSFAAIPEESPKEFPTKEHDSLVEPGQEPLADMALLMMDPTLPEETYPSPDGLYIASLGIDKDEILLDKEGRAYFISKHHWELPWEIEQIEWVSPRELYYVLYHPENQERQYWLIEAEERVETKLDAPYGLRGGAPSTRAREYK